jgi:hypothetical protein
MWSAWFFFFNALTVTSSPLTEVERASLMPLPSEKIQEIKLAKKCENVSIIEWQDGPPTEDKIKIINEICNLAVKNFPIFLKKKKINITNKLNLKVSISFLNKGFGSRQLNDSKRFVSLNLPKHEDGTPHVIYGYYHFGNSHIFALNDFISNNKPNTLFKMILAHEIFHALTHQNNLIEKFPDPIYESDEDFAREFTSFLGLGQ